MKAEKVVSEADYLEIWPYVDANIDNLVSLESQ